MLIQRPRANRKHGCLGVDYRTLRSALNRKALSDEYRSGDHIVFDVGCNNSWTVPSAETNGWEYGKSFLVKYDEGLVLIITA